MPFRHALPLCLIALVWFAPDMVYGQNNRLIEPKDIAHLEYVTGAEMSPNGKHIAYLLAVPRRPLQDDDGSAWYELHVMDRQTGVTRPFITGEVSISSPQWSPDGKSIYYTSKRSDDKMKSLYRIPIDGGESVRVLGTPTSMGSFDISDDGNHVAFLAKEEQDDAIQDLEDEGFNQEIYEEDWLPTRVWVAALEGDSGRDAKQPKPRMLDLNGSAISVLWNPDGDELMVVLAPTPSVDDSYMQKRVFVVNAESGKVIRSLNNPGKLGQVSWSPDGEHLAIVSAVDIHDPEEGRLMVTSVHEESGLVDLIPGLKAHVHTISWKDNSTLYWLAAEGITSRFGIVTLEGDVTDLLAPGGDGDPVFKEFTASDDHNAFAFLGSAATYPTEIFLSDKASQKPQRMTDSNPWLKDKTFARQTVVTWKGEDGLELQGILIYPLDYVSGQKYPTIMYVHGGPESHESNAWLTSYSRPGQVAAGRGFAVFYPNYRGSTGRGVEFSMMGQSDAAGKEFSDLIAGVDHLIDAGITDPDAVGVTGGSYGGYASAWCSTFYSDRFAASVMFVGISDNVSKVGTTDIPEEMFLVHHRKHLWDDWNYFLESSPIRHIEKNQTPTLIMHGKEDPRVHPSQSLEFHRHLKTLKQAPVRLVLYEGEGHGNRKAAARFDYNLRMLRWMEHFLKDKAEKSPAMRIDYRKALGMPAEKE
ncbi:MAG: S9 family peptidase [Rubripirellula sp.]|nr:S9 family peptidase [Rubripirellula sp.]